jgi:hypothetical protein
VKISPQESVLELVPSGVVTVTATSPALPGGLVAVINVELLTVKEAALLEPKSTAVAPLKFVPVMVTWVSPEVGPAFGLTPESSGVGGLGRLPDSTRVCSGWVVLPG